jgi:hypothetical protein
MPEPMSEMTLRAYGRTISLAGPAAALSAARDRLPPTYRVVDGTPERRWEVTEGLHFEVDTDGTFHPLPFDVVAATEAVLSDLELWIAEHAKRSVFVHAGCVAVDGRAIVLPGRTMSGKSSLTAALVRAGADYYSDEYAVFDHLGAVRPYSRKLAMRPTDGSAAKRVDPSELGGKSGRGPASVAFVAVLRFDASIGWRPEPLSRGQAIIRLFDNMVAARSRPRAGLSALEGVTLDARAFAGTRGDADETAARLLTMLSE